MVLMPIDELGFYAFKIKALSNVISTKYEERSFLSQLIRFIGVRTLNSFS
jgi:hypothetical protein